MGFPLDKPLAESHFFPDLLTFPADAQMTSLSSEGTVLIFQDRFLGNFFPKVTITVAFSFQIKTRNYITVYLPIVYLATLEI